jgi:hypothetical protein
MGGIYYPPDGDWERDGKGIGRNTHIKELWFGDNLPGLPRLATRDDIEAFCGGLANNKSIERLTMCCAQPFDGECLELWWTPQMVRSI